MWWARLLNNAIAVYQPQGTPPSTNSYESIATVTVGSGGTSTITFSSIPSTYKHLQVRGIGKSTNGANGANLFLKANSDAGNNYSWHQLYGDGVSTGAGGIASLSPVITTSLTGTASTSTFASTVIDILDYANTSKYKTFRSLGGYDVNAGGVVQLRSSVWMNTAAINTLTFTVDGYNFSEYSSFALYGIKG